MKRTSSPSEKRHSRTRRRSRVGLLAGCTLLCLSSCASVEFRRETASSGTFEAVGWSFTLVSIDLPKSALDIARSNVSDARQLNTRVDEISISPNLGIFDWVFEIVGFRRAKLTGTWGFPPE